MEKQKSNSPKKKNCFHLQKLPHFREFYINYNIKIFHSSNKKLFLFLNYIFQNFLLVILNNNFFLVNSIFGEKSILSTHFSVLEIVMRKFLEQIFCLNLHILYFFHFWGNSWKCSKVFIIVRFILWNFLCHNIDKSATITYSYLCLNFFYYRIHKKVNFKVIKCHDYMAALY